MNRSHIPVLADELVALLELEPGQRVIDCTFGLGGHATMVAERIGPDGELICIDRDPAAIGIFERIDPDLSCRTRFIHSNFADALEQLAADGVEADAVYFDFGLSSPQVDSPERGFSYSRDAPLDMRMDPSEGESARDLVNNWPESRIADVLRREGEEKHARSIAREIVARRPFERTGELVDAIRAAVPPAVRFGRGHPAKKTFQALRIAVNDELASIDRALPAAWELLGPGGRMAAISFHSLEDRRVKRFIADLARGCVCPPELPVCTCGHEPEAEPLTRKPLSPTPDEIAGNPRARSAHLRGARRLSPKERTA